MGLRFRLKGSYGWLNKSISPTANVPAHQATAAEPATTATAPATAAGAPVITAAAPVTTAEAPATAAALENVYGEGRKTFVGRSGRGKLLRQTHMIIPRDRRSREASSQV
jgi:hypothetical protein